MARKANDGTEFTNQMMVNRHNARLAARGPEPAKPEAPKPDKPKSIHDDAHAMSLVDELKKLGYSVDDVVSAMGGDDNAQDDHGRAAVAAAPLQIPGLG